MTELELKPCPFCGGEPTPIMLGLVCCENCALTDTTPEGLVCKRFGAFYHLTEPQGYCKWGKPKEPPCHT